MLGRNARVYIPEGALFYQQTKRRERVKFDEDLRNMVEADFLQSMIFSPVDGLPK